MEYLWDMELIFALALSCSTEQWAIEELMYYCLHWIEPAFPLRLVGVVVVNQRENVVGLDLGSAS